MTTREELDYWVKRLPSTAPAMRKHYEALEEAQRTLEKRRERERLELISQARKERERLVSYMLVRRGPPITTKDPWARQHREKAYYKWLAEEKAARLSCLAVLQAPVIDTVVRITGVSLDTIQRSKGKRIAMVRARMMLAFFLSVRLGMNTEAIRRVMRCGTHTVHLSKIRAPQKWPEMVRAIDRILIG